MEKCKEIQEIADKINKLLDKNPLAFPAIGLAEFLQKKYTIEDWQDYEKETGNQKFSYQPPENGFDALIDETTSYKDIELLNYAKFVLWNVEEFIKGLNENL